jgi:hypothetical protein
MPDEEKRRRADIVIETDKDENLTRIEVAELVHAVLRAHDARTRAAVAAQGS